MEDSFCIAIIVQTLVNILIVFNFRVRPPLLGNDVKINFSVSSEPFFTDSTSNMKRVAVSNVAIISSSARNGIADNANNYFCINVEKLQ